MSKSVIIAIDGPAGSGKSTAAKNVAERLGYLYVDTGAMYRAVTYAVLREGIKDNEEKITALVKKADLKLKFENGVTRVFLNGEEVTKEIRTPEVNGYVSPVARIPEVRYALVEKQQKLAEGGSIVAEGRDTTTVVYPNADVKIYLVANINARAERRLKEFKEQGVETTLGDVLENLKERDRIDSSRSVGPLKKAEDAVEIDTSAMTIEEEIEMIIKLARETADG